MAPNHSVGIGRRAARSAEDRIRDLALSTDLPAAEIHRRIRAGSDGGQPLKVSYRSTALSVRLARATSPDVRRADPASMAARILALLNADLTRLEAASGPADLDRLDRIARTLRTVEPIRAAPENKKIASLRSLAPPGSEQVASPDGSA